MLAAGSRRLPKYEPSAPPTATAPSSASAGFGNAPPRERLPSSPALEFTRMKSALTAAAFFAVAQRISNNNGVRKMPPPVPVSPASRPSAPPVPSATGSDGGPATICSRGSSTSRTAENKSTAPTSTLNALAGSATAPPTNASGTASSANGQNSRHEKCPARKNCTLPIVATRMFSASAVGFITSGATPNSDITAR